MTERAPRHRSHSVVAALLIVLGVVCMTLSPVAVWGRNQVLNTDRYVHTMTPVASDAGVQDLVIAAVDRQLLGHLDMKSVLSGLPPAVASAIEGPLRAGVQSLVVSETTKFVRGPSFQRLWVAANRDAHKQVVRLLTGDLPPGSAVAVNSAGDVTLDLSTVVDKVKQRLVTAGLPAAAAVPTAGATVRIGQLPGLAKTRSLINVLNKVANWLPLAGILLLVAGVFVARDHRRAVVRSGLGVAAGMLLLGIALIVGRAVYLHALASTEIPRSTAAFLFDTLLRSLRWGVRVMLLAALVVAVAGWLAGRSTGAVAVRRWFTTGPRRFVAKTRAGAVGRFLAVNLSVVRIAVVAVGGVILLLTDAPSLVTVVGLCVAVAIVLLLVETLRSRDAVEELSHA